MALTYPLITVSTRAQIQSKSTETNAFKAQLQAAQKIVQEEGIAGLYSYADLSD